MRCAAYSAAASRPLYIPRSTSPSGDHTSSAIDHFRDKLFSLNRMMRTVKGKEIADRRTEYMRGFVAQVELEWLEVADGS